MSVVLMALEIKVLIAPRGFLCHLIWPLKVWFVLDFLQHPMYWFSKHNTDSLCVGCSGLSYEISSRAVAVILIRPKIPHLLRDNLFPFPYLVAGLLLLIYTYQSDPSVGAHWWQAYQSETSLSRTRLGDCF